MRAAISSKLLIACAVLACTPAAQSQTTDNPSNTDFSIGIVRGHDLARDTVGQKAVRKAYEVALGQPVRLVILPDYRALVRAQARSSVDYAIYSATAYALAWEHCACVEPVVAAVSTDGRTGVAATLIVGKSAPESLAEIPNLRIAVPAADNFASYAIALQELTPGSFPLSGDETFLHRTDSMSESEDLFLSGKVDGLLGWAYTQRDGSVSKHITLERLQQKGMRKEDMKVLWTSSSARFGPHAVRTDIDQDTLQKLRGFLVSLAEENPDVFAHVEPYHSGKFQAVGHTDYRSALNAVAVLKKK